MDVWIGYDERESEAYKVAEHSLRAHAHKPVRVNALKADDLFDKRMLWRPITKYVSHIKDHLSDAPQSTEFATSRFLVPFLQRTGWALFVDCDVVFLGDVYELGDGGQAQPRPDPDHEDGRRTAVCVSAQELVKRDAVELRPRRQPPVRPGNGELVAGDPASSVQLVARRRDRRIATRVELAGWRAGQACAPAYCSFYERWTLAERLAGFAT